jgi:hypothetical protein
MAHDEPTEDIVKREIAAARKILREDKVLSAHRELMGKLTPPEQDDPENPPAPKPRDPPEPPAKRGVWWGKQ